MTIRNASVRPVRATHAAASALIALAAALVTSASAGAQESTNTPAPTQPGVGLWNFKQKFMFEWEKDDPGSTRTDRMVVQSLSTLVLGVTRDVSLSLDVPAVLADSGTDVVTGARDLFSGVPDLSVSMKYRFLEQDTSPIDTLRASFITGLEIPSGDRDYSSRSLDPFIGVTAMMIRDRLGVTQSLRWKFNTSGTGTLRLPGDSDADTLRSDTALLYRISPEKYDSTTTAALYAQLELNLLYEVTGEHTLKLSPGILYEAQTFALEASVQIPISDNLRRRGASKLGFTIGFRLLF